MNLFIFIHSMSAGGAERVTANLANYWADRGHRITIVTMASTERDFYELRPSITRLSLGLAINSSGPLQALYHNFRRVFALRRVLLQEKPDIALAMMTTANCLLALAEDEERMERMFQFRFREGEGLKGHALGNLVLAALEQATGGFDRAVEEASHFLSVRGQVLPATLDRVDLVAEMEDGGEVVGVAAYQYPQRFAQGRVEAVGRQPSVHELNRSWAQVSRVIVHPNYRGAGLATKLLADLSGGDQDKWNGYKAALDKLDWFYPYDTSAAKDKIAEKICDEQRFLVK